MRRRKFLHMLPGIVLPGQVLLRAATANAHELEPGDYGYRHDEFHRFYQLSTVFGGHCFCGNGTCRATIWRPTELRSPVGFDVIIERQWWPLPATVYQPDSMKLPPELFVDKAHVCAESNGDKGPKISCVIINMRAA